MASGEAERIRVIKIGAVDTQGLSVDGYAVEIFIADRPVGAFVGGRDHRATVEVNESVGTITLVGSYGDQRIILPVPRGTNEQRFVFARAKGVAAPARAEARCPDGSTGTPCVICQVGPLRVRICV
jgi:hypothetical protein